MKGNLGAHLRRHHKGQGVKCKFLKCLAVFRTEKNLEEHLAKKHFLTEGRNPIECDVCKYFFVSKKSLDNHMKTHSEKFKRSFKCKFCSETFSSKVLLNRHTEANHSEEAVKCRRNHCKFYFKTKKQMQEHFANEHNLKCKFCPSTFHNRTFLATHLNKIHPESKCKFSQCTFYSDSKAEMDEHLKEKHAKRRDATECFYCGNIINRTNMSRHIHMKHSKNAIKCEKVRCGLFFKNLEDLEEHKKSVHEQEKHRLSVVCFFCQKIIIDSRNLGRHVQRKHSKEALNRCKYRNSFTFFKSEEDRRKHLEEKHAEKFSCALSEYKASRKMYLLTHLKKHHLPKETKAKLRDIVKSNEKCPHCLQIRTDLHYHVVTANCPICYQVFRCKKLFYDHKLHCKKVHECGECGIKFKVPSLLKLHINLRHKSGKKWKGHECKFCGKFFKELKLLKSHQFNEHSDLLKFKCALCDEAFFRRNDINSHIATKHEIGGIKCKLCGKNFACQFDLSRHLLQKRRQQLVECADCGKIVKKSWFALHYNRRHLKNY